MSNEFKLVPVELLERFDSLSVDDYQGWANEAAHLLRALHAQPATAKVDEREEFEAWVKEIAEKSVGGWHPSLLDRFSDESADYRAAWVYAARLGWQARDKLSGGRS